MTTENNNLAVSVYDELYFCKHAPLLKQHLHAV